MKKSRKILLTNLTRLYFRSKFQKYLDFDEVYNLIGNKIQFNPDADSFIDFVKQVQKHFEKQTIALAA